MTGSKLLARFGILADVQYADVCDKPAIYDPSKTRYYRASLDHVVRAFEIWDKEDKKPGFVLQLGDIIDGLNKNTNGLDPSEAMSKTLAAFEAHPTIPTFHAVGNHELYNFKRAEIAQLFRDSLIYRTKVKTDLLGLSLNLDDWSSPGARKDDCSLYYKFNPCPGVKFIALDCFEISVIGYDTSHENYQKAAKILYEHHGHDDYDLWDTGESLNSGPEKRFQQQNGAISENQLLWLTEELADSERKGEKVIVFGHVGLHPGSCDTSCLLWNYDEVLKVFHRFNCVVSYMSGHTHTFGHSVDEKGIHYLVYHGVIETSPEEEAFATVCLYEDHMFVKGYGVEKTLDLGIPSRHSNVLNECVDEILSEELISNDAESATNNCSTVTVSV